MLVSRLRLMSIDRLAGGRGGGEETMEIRFLTAGDAGEFWRLRLEALQGTPEAFSSSEEEHRTLSMDEVRARLGSAGGDSFVAGAIDAGCLVGMAGFHRERGRKSVV